MWKVRMTSCLQTPPSLSDQQESLSTNYRVQAVLGEGTFGKVVRCLKVDTNESVAVKVFKQDFFGREVKKEVAMLKGLRHLDLDKCHIVKWYDCFASGGRTCLVFEELDISLLDYMRQRQSSPLPLRKIRPIIQQLSMALKSLRTVGMIHTDLKPDNVMLVNCLQEPIRVKLIDFGMAIRRSEAKIGHHCQPLCWRSPEIILGLPFSEAIDIWSLGCLMGGLFLGNSFYSGTSEYDLLRLMMHTRGEPGQHLLNAGTQTASFFKREDHQRFWRFKTPAEYTSDTGILCWPQMFFLFDSLDDLREFNRTADDGTEVEDRSQFVILLKQMLEMDAAKRILPAEVLSHPFITLSHLSDSNHDCSHGKSSSLAPSLCAGSSEATPPVSEAVDQRNSRPSFHPRGSWARSRPEDRKRRADFLPQPAHKVP
ncbi:homeodomain-interacting protein kinase 2-like, partial [Centroberyx affinis]|uniref:homeodomain-interacting protein kinase 2-like n=1 Tax=Centroberyx affinis TaxID=166261 RepID=UPI003A5C4046